MSDPVLIKQRTYRTKPTTVEAQQYDGSDASACAVLYWLGGHQGGPGLRLGYVDSLGNLWIRVYVEISGPTFRLAKATEWIVRSFGADADPSRSGLSVVDAETFALIFELDRNTRSWK